MVLKVRRLVRWFLPFYLLTLLPFNASAATKAQADSAYAQGHFQQAIADYEALLKQGASADLYYNLGNAYYRSENITQAVLNYERALLLSPGDRDIRFNLQLARSKTIDKIVPESEMFFVTWYHSLVNLMSVDGWARTAIISLALVIVLSLVYLFSQPVWLRKIGFFGGITLLVVFIHFRQCVRPPAEAIARPSQGGYRHVALRHGEKYACCQRHRSFHPPRGHEGHHHRWFDARVEGDPSGRW